jgi:lipopolysaccharide exporter
LNMESNKYVMRKSFKKNVLTLLTGTSIAQLLTLLLAPILARLFTPTEIGILQVYITVVYILNTIMTLKYELAIVVPEDREKAKAIFYVCLLINITMFLLLLVVFALLGKDILTMLNIPTEYSLLMSLLIPCGALCIGVYNTLNYWSTRQLKYKRLARSRIARSTGIAVPQITGGVLGLGASGLFLGQFLGQFIATFTLALQVWINDKTLLLRNLSKVNLKETIKEYKVFPLYSFPQDLIYVFSQSLVVIFFTFSYGSSLVGYYAMASRVIQMPLNLVGEALRQVYFQKAASLYNENKLSKENLLSIIIKMFLVGVLPVISLSIFIPGIFNFLLGDSWEFAGYITRILLIWLFLDFLCKPIYAVIQVLGIQKLALIHEVILFIVRVAVLTISVSLFEPLTTITIFSVISGLANIILIIIVTGKLDKITKARIGN